MSRFSRATARIAKRFMTARYEEALNRLSDRQLADIGLTREGIPASVRELV